MSPSKFCYYILFLWTYFQLTKVLSQSLNASFVHIALFLLLVFYCSWKIYFNFLEFNLFPLCFFCFLSSPVVCSVVSGSVFNIRRFLKGSTGLSLLIHIEKCGKLEILLMWAEWSRHTTHFDENPPHPCIDTYGYLLLELIFFSLEQNLQYFAWDV